MAGAEREGAAMLAEFARRLNHLCDEAGIPPKHQGRQTKLAQLLKITQRATRRWLEGLGMPSRHQLRKLATLFRCNTAWLESGEGEKRPTGMSAPTIAGNQVLLTLNRTQELIVQAYAERYNLPYAVAAEDYFLSAINADIDAIGWREDDQSTEGPDAKKNRDIANYAERGKKKRKKKTIPIDSIR